MKTKDLDYIRDIIEVEGGAEYAFIHYSNFEETNFEEIKDEEFHKLRVAFVDAYADLMEYLNLDKD